jgi:hypothetical protein
VRKQLLQVRTKYGIVLQEHYNRLQQLTLFHMSGEFSSEELEYYALEDQAIADVAHELAEAPWSVSPNEINGIIEKLRLGATVAVNGNGYRIVRTPLNRFEILADASAENEDILHAA